MTDTNKEVLRRLRDAGWGVTTDLPAASLATARYLELVAPFSRRSTSRLGLSRAAPTRAVMAPSTNYQVAFQNVINETIEEIALFWQYPGQIVQFDHAKNIAFNQFWTFTLGPCNPGLTYSIGVFWSGGFHKHPAQGMLNPGSQPDNDPCSDAWVINYEFLQ